ncbi:MAG: HD domain-containing phosphohydrolase [Solirubrobacteraceae bacterium]
MPRPHRLLFAACAAWLALHELRAILAPGLNAGPLFDRAAHDVVLLLAAGLCLARVPAVRGRERLAWALIGAGVLAWSLGEVFYTAVLWEDADPPIPSPADLGFLLFPPLVLAGALVLLRSRARGLPRGLWVDGLTAALGVSALSAAIVFETVLESVEGKPLAVATGLAYPLWDLVLLGLFVGALASTGWRLDRTWMLLAAGVSTFWLADSMYLVQTARGTYESGGWFDAGWWAGLVLIAAAAWQAPPELTRQRAEERLRAIAVPLGFGAVGLGLLVYGSVAGLNPLAVGLAAASLLAVMARATVTFGENVVMLRTSRDEALTDALTGLGNRRALTRALEQQLEEARPERPLVLALFDLDGFKHYNDTFGHPAGDTLLVRLGGNLAAFLHGRGSAFRMGGDEFCALFESGPEGPEPMVMGAAAALSEQGDGFTITCSHGAITLPVEAAAPADALRIADQRMYANKHAGRISAGRQSTDVLLRALAERDPGLGTHADAVELAAATADRLGLAPDEIERVRHATELHDVGKMAIPDAILGKPGPLTEEEWTFVRRHPVIGERIVLAAPALTRVARLVRASHERWDGTGYPDALEGEAIPVGGRIVAVADAFAAMTTGRPYRAARTPDDALEELRRCAGTQFDPVVVEAWCAAWAGRVLSAAG